MTSNTREYASKLRRRVKTFLRNEGWRDFKSSLQEARRFIEELDPKRSSSIDLIVVGRPIAYRTRLSYDFMRIEPFVRIWAPRHLEMYGCLVAALDGLCLVRARLQTSEIDADVAISEMATIRSHALSDLQRKGDTL